MIGPKSKIFTHFRPRPKYNRRNEGSPMRYFVSALRHYDTAIGRYFLNEFVTHLAAGTKSKNGLTAAEIVSFRRKIRQGKRLEF